MDLILPQTGLVFPDTVFNPILGIADLENYTDFSLNTINGSTIEKQGGSGSDFGGLTNIAYDGTLFNGHGGIKPLASSGSHTLYTGALSEQQTVAVVFLDDSQSNHVLGQGVDGVLNNNMRLITSSSIAIRYSNPLTNIGANFNDDATNIIMLRYNDENNLEIAVNSNEFTISVNPTNSYYTILNQFIIGGTAGDATSTGAAWAAFARWTRNISDEEATIVYNQLSGRFLNG